MEVNCKFCGKLFNPKTNRNKIEQKYCTPSCRTNENVFNSLKKTKLKGTLA